MFLLCYVLCIFFIKITYTFLRLVFKISSLFVLFSDPDKVLIVVSSPEGIVSILFQLISDFYRTSPLLSAVIAMIVTVCPPVCLWYNFNKKDLRWYGLHQTIVQTIFFQRCKDVAEIRRVSPQETIFCKYPHSGIRKARENEYNHSEQAAAVLRVRQRVALGCQLHR